MVWCVCVWVCVYEYFVVFPLWLLNLIFLFHEYEKSGRFLSDLALFHNHHRHWCRIWMLVILTVIHLLYLSACLSLSRSLSCVLSFFSVRYILCHALPLYRSHHACVYFHINARAHTHTPSLALFSHLRLALSIVICSVHQFQAD